MGCASRFGPILCTALASKSITVLNQANFADAEGSLVTVAPSRPETFR